MPREVVFIGLGSNQEDPVQQIRQAVISLKQLPDSEWVTLSSLYRSKPMGSQDQDDYVNAVAQMNTSLSPFKLLDELQRIENEQGRVRTDGEQWGPRTLDLDLLLFGDKRIDHERLKVPHYGIKDRSFVLFPLYEIAPYWILPNGETVKSWASSISREGIEKIQ